MNECNMIVKACINIAMIHFVILIRHLHIHEKLNDNRQEVNCANALNFITGSAVRPFNMSTEQIDDIGSQTQFSTKLNQILKISSEQIAPGQSNAEYVNAIGNSLDILNEIKANTELSAKMKHDDIMVKRNTEENLNEIIGLMEYKEMRQASNYVRSKKRVILDQSSTNNKLFNKLVTTGVDMFNAVEQNGDGSQHGICQIHCKMRDDVHEEDLRNFEQFTNYDIQINDNGKIK